MAREINTEAHSRAIQEVVYGNYPDRVLAIVTAALLDDHVTACLTESLWKDDKTTSRLFSGALSGLSSKIDLAYLMGLYTVEVRDDLKTIAKIRNEFAHNPTEVTFETAKIIDLCQNLKIAKYLSDGNGWLHGGRTVVEGIIVSHRPARRLPELPRDIFVECFMLLLRAVTFHEPQRPKPWRNE
jgi:hypothetical protein